MSRAHHKKAHLRHLLPLVAAGDGLRLPIGACGDPRCASPRRLAKLRPKPVWSREKRPRHFPFVSRLNSGCSSASSKDSDWSGRILTRYDSDGSFSGFDLRELRP